ncbi:MAG: ABC transporter ATP-binding protein [Acidobacteriota bacterium]
MRLTGLVWPVRELGEGLEPLARAAGLPVRRRGEPLDPAKGLFATWMQASADWLDLEAQEVTARFGELDQVVRSGGPMLIHLGNGRYLLLIRQRWGKAELLGRDLARHRVSAKDLVAHLRSPLVGKECPRLEAILDGAEVSPRRRKRALDTLLRDGLADRLVEIGWLLRQAPHSAFPQRLARAGLGRRCFGLLGVHALQYVLFLAAWWLVGRGALGGDLAPGWMAAWALLLVTLVPLRMLSGWLMGDLSIRAGAELKRRFLYGALRLDRDTSRSQGAGGALGRVLESEAVEALALSGGLMALTSVVELPLAAWVLTQGAGGLVHLGLFVGVLLLTCGWAVRVYRASERWTEKRLGMTHRLVEKMVGHQTRLAQEPAAQRHTGEAAELDTYRARLEDLDRRTVVLLLLPRIWLVLALAALVPALASGAGEATIAIALGGVLLVEQALAALGQGLTALATAAISWRQVAPLFRAGGREPELGLPALRALAEAGPEEVGSTLLEARGVSFRYAGRGRPVLDGCDLVIRRGDRLLLEGPSGGGKSTLAALLSGQRTPTSGLLRLAGMDRPSVGLDTWRRRVVMVPQFHDNHVLTETFAFNLLMGRGWPPSFDDLAEAEKLCVELGLGDLLHRMPAGLQQMVGETGWQLSHGERSRLFMARALLQDADLLILDESFAALDPENLRQAMECALRRSQTVMVIAHP